MRPGVFPGGVGGTVVFYRKATERRARRTAFPATRVAFVTLIAAALLIGGTANAFGNKSGEPIPPGSFRAALNGGYPELTARWWTWATGIFPDTPILDETGELCGQGQKGRIWFLAGSFGNTVVRDCTIRGRKTLFFPVFNTLWWTPEDGPTAEAVRVLANQSVDVEGLTMEVLVDGEPVEDIFGYRAQSPPGGSPYTVLEGSAGNVLFGIEPGVRDPSVADGYWVMLRPLSRGEHTVVIRAFFETPDFTFDLDVTYNITVE